MSSLALLGLRIGWAGAGSETGPDGNEHELVEERRNKEDLLRINMKKSK